MSTTANAAACTAAVMPTTTSSILLSASANFQQLGTRDNRQDFHHTFGVEGRMQLSRCLEV